MIILLSLIKFILALALVPVVIGTTVAFYDTVSGMKNNFEYFAWGIGYYVVIHLFVFKMQAFYAFMQKIFSETFRFSSILANSLPLVVPIVPTLLFLIFYIAKFFTNQDAFMDYFMFAVGFSLAMHVILTAQSLYDEDTTGFKAHYFFVMTLVYIINIVLTVLLLGLDFPKVEFVEFFRQAADIAWDIYKSVAIRMVFPVK